MVLALLFAALAGWGLGKQNVQPQVEPIVVTNEVDIGFAQGMLVHHGQAIHMAMLVKDSESPEVQGLAQSILINQTHESGLLRGWLTAWNAPVMVAGPPMAWVENAKNLTSLEDIQYASQCKASGGVMPGMATPEQLDQLRTAKGEEQSRLFFNLMMAHHRAALPMAGFAIRNGSSSLIKNFALAMAKDQSTEIAWMERRLSSDVPL
ncbi:MAG: DUF305 domain-containing protein [Limnobacter sp.]|nr:DUF305 domain-containing protein [Limnobacter sp.]